jgi:PAS domain S-box-containing protein
MGTAGSRYPLYRCVSWGILNAEPNTSAKPKGSPEREVTSGAEPRRGMSEKRQQELLFLTFALLFVVTSVFAWFSWDWLKTQSIHLEALPIGLVVMVGLLGLYVWKKTQGIAELRGMVRELDQKNNNVPDELQADQFFQMILKSQQGFRDLIDSFDDVLIALSLDGDIRAVNRSFADLVGETFPNIIGRPLADFASDQSGTAQETLGRGMAKFIERRAWTGIVQIRLNGRNTDSYFECTAHAMVRDDKVHGMTVLARDITSVRRNEVRFTELFETLQEGIYIVTPDDHILEVNPALVRMLGYDSKEELLAKRVSEVFVDETQRSTMVREVNRQPEPQSREITLRRKDGEALVCLNTATVMRDAAGKVTRYHGAVVDITERRAIERKLHKEQEFARRLVDSFPDLIFVVDAEKRYTFVSPRVKEVLGFAADEMVGTTLGEITHTDDRSTLSASVRDILTGKATFGSTEVRVRHKQGDWRRLKCNFSPLFDESGKTEGIVISGRDVTEVKRLEEQLIQAEKLASMGQMLAGVAHELNNPLTAILGVSELLRDREGIDESAKRQLEMTHRQARRAARIVQNLLEFSRPASPQKKSLDMNTIIERTLQLHEHSLKRNNVQVEFHPTPGLPAVIGDANQLIQIFLNLISNAEQAIHEVRTSGRIQIHVAQSGGRVTTTVQDDGVGIKPETLPKLFDPFFTTKRPGGGTGLGLSICMSIVREHGGNILAETLPAGGAAFTVSLPAVARTVNTLKDLDTSSGEWIPPSMDLLHNRSLLVLDDEESIRMLLSEGLTAHGLQVNCAGTAEQALSLVLGRKFDVILCDLKLAGSGPNSDGYSVAERLRVAAGTNKPEIIFMSGDVFTEQDKGPSDARRLQKPFRISDVLNLLMEVFVRVPVGSKR